jgi:hypothetical protein
MTRSRWAAGGLLALVFALGALTGGAATSLADRDPGGRRDPWSPQSYAEFLGRELTLDPSQQKVIVEVIERHLPVMDSIWSALKEDYAAQRQAMRKDIRALLTEEQLAKYNGLTARFDSLRREREKRHGSR